MNLEQLIIFEYQCHPTNHKDSNIKGMTVTIHAKDKEEADFIFNNYSRAFFSQKLSIVKQVKYKGFRQVK